MLICSVSVMLNTLFIISSISMVIRNKYVCISLIGGNMIVIFPPFLFIYYILEGGDIMEDIDISIYEYDAHKVSTNMIDRILYLMNIRKWSVMTLSEKSSIPYDTLKKIVGMKTEHTSIHNIIKIATALHCSIDFLVGLDIPNRDSENILEYLKGLERSMRPGTFVPVYASENVVSKNSVHAIIEIGLLDITEYDTIFRIKLSCGIRIIGNHYYPIYCDQDILLIASDRNPVSGETAVFMHNGRLHIRKYFPYPDKTVLTPINGIGEIINMTSLVDWVIFGYVVGIHKPQ